MKNLKTNFALALVAGSLLTAVTSHASLDCGNNSTPDYSCYTVNDCQTGGTPNTSCNPTPDCNPTPNPHNITSVPEPSTIVAGALLLLPFGISTVRILRKSKQEA